MHCVLALEHLKYVELHVGVPEMCQCVFGVENGCDLTSHYVILPGFVGELEFVVVGGGA